MNNTPQQDPARQPNTDPRRRPLVSLLGPMRIRKKLILLHTGFSIAMGVALLLTIRPAGLEIVRLTTERNARVGVALAVGAPIGVETGVTIERGSALELGIPELEARRMLKGEAVRLTHPGDVLSVGAWDRGAGEFVVASASSGEARRIVARLNTLIIVALLAIYFAIALTLEVFVLPRYVYAPIQRLRRADLAVQMGIREAELIPERDIPSDELGEIMRSRNQSITRLREQERQLTSALDRLETVAADLKQKNELIETAQRNLADQDRLVSLGVMSAGLAHEMNTPLSVLKGAAESILEKPNEPVPREQAELMHRVVGRLERLSEGLLDFARVRPPHTRPVTLRDVIDEAWTLVSLDRAGKRVRFTNRVGADVVIPGDADRLMQVFVNLFRNSVDAMDGRGVIEVDSDRIRREGRSWWSIRFINDGPRIDPEILPRIFEPFESTRLDDRGTGLGLAITEGIVREHGGFIVARNREPTGCVFEITLPLDTPVESEVSPEGSEEPQ